MKIDKLIEELKKLKKYETPKTEIYIINYNITATNLKERPPHWEKPWGCANEYIWRIYKND